MADSVAEVKVRIKLDDADTFTASLGRVTGELKAKLANLKSAIQQAQQTGSPLDVEKLRASQREIEASIARVQKLRDAAKVDYARTILDVRPYKDVQREIDLLQAAYRRLADSGKLSAAEMAQAFSNLQTKIVELKAQTSGLSTSFEAIKSSLAGLITSFAALGGSVRAAASFESAMIDFARATGQTKEEVAQLGQQFQALAVKYGMAAGGIAAIATVGGKMGVANAQMAQFVDTVAKAALNFDMLPDEAAKALATLSAVLKVPVSELDAFAGAINAVADSVGVMERDVIIAMTRAASSAQALGLTKEQTAALAATLIRLGANSEEAGTAIRTFSTRLRLAVNDSGQAGKALQRIVGDVRQFAQTLYTDGQKAVLQFIAALSRLPGPERLAALKEIFGEGLDTENIAKLADGAETYGKALEAATGTADDFRAALERLTQMKLGSVEQEFKSLKQAVEAVGEAFGSLILPAVRLVTVALTAVAQALKAFIDEMPATATFVGTLAGIAIAANALRLVFGGLVAVFGRAATAAASFFAPLLAWLPRVATLTAPVAAAIGAIGPAFLRLLGPIGVAITAIEAAVWAWGKFTAEGEKAPSAIQRALPQLEAGLRDASVAIESVASTVADQMEAMKKRAETAVKEIADGYKKLAGDVRAAMSDKVAAIDDAYKRADVAAKRYYQSEAQEIRGSTARLISAEREKVAAVEQAAQKLGAAWERTYRSAIDLARTAGQDTVALEREAVQERISIYQQIEQAYRGTIDRLIAEEQRHLDAARRAEEERLNLKLSVEDRIREIARKGMDEYAAYQDRLRQIDEKQAAARQALAAGDFERAKRLANEAISLAERSANEVTRRVDQNGKTVTQTVVSQAQASARAIAEIRESARIADQALAALGNAHRDAANQAGSAADAVKRQLESVRKEIETLRSGLIGKEEVQLKVKADGVDEIARKLRELADAKEIIARVKADTEDAKRALEALQKDADNRELLLKAKLASDQVAADIENLKTTLARDGIQVPAKFDEALVSLRSFSDTVRSELSAPTQHTHTPTVDLSQYYAARRELEQTTSSEHIIYVRKVETNAIGGLVGRFATGGQALGMRFRRLVGRITGPGTSTSDSIPAMLSNGEFVIRASSVRKFGVEFFEALNAGRLPALLGLAASPVRVPQIAIQNATERGASDAQLRILLESPGRQPVRLISERDKVRELVEMLRAAGLTVQARPV